MAYRYHEEHDLPDARQVTDGAITRYPHIFEVEPHLMTVHVQQQNLPSWDTLRIAHSRADHLAWMHKHWTSTVVSGEQLLADLDDAAAETNAVSRADAPADSAESLRHDLRER